MAGGTDRVGRMRIPDWYEGLLLGVAAWRTFQLLAFDDILSRPRNWLLHLDADWKDPGYVLPENYRFEWAQFITCAYCAGTWVATAWWVAWQISGKWTLVVASLVALWAIPIAGHRLLAKEEDR
jgi:uncharacterized protein DUF1360